jgi:hypothetical protein
MKENVRLDSSVSLDGKSATVDVARFNQPGYDYLFDRRTYGTLIGNIGAALNKLRTKADDPNQAKERRISHTKFEGSFVMKGDSYVEDTSPVVLAVNGLDPDDLSCPRRHHVGLNGLSDALYLNGTSESRSTTRIDEFINVVEKLVGTGSAENYHFRISPNSSNELWYWVTDVSLSVDPDGNSVLRYSYGVKQRHYNVFVTAEWHTIVRFYVHDTVSPGVHVPKRHMSLEYEAYVTNVATSAYNCYVIRAGDQVKQSWELHPIVAYWRNYDGNQDEIDDAFDVLNHYMRAIESPIGDFLGWANASTMQACDELTETLNSNMVEFAAELNTLGGYPSFGAFEVFADKLTKVKGVNALFSVLDFASDAVLLYRFGLQPFTSDIQDIASKWDQLVQRYLNGYPRAGTAYGKITRTKSFRDHDYSVVIRSKVRYFIPKQHMMNQLMPLGVANLSPSLANLWDIIPFSFAIDWFYDVGGRLDAIGDGFHLIHAEVPQYVHSYTFTGNLNDFFPEVVGDVRVSVYRREVSQYFPFPRPELIDEGQSNGPPMLIGGSLLWALLRS